MNCNKGQSVHSPEQLLPPKTERETPKSAPRWAAFTFTLSQETKEPRRANNSCTNRSSPGESRPRNAGMDLQQSRCTGAGKMWAHNVGRASWAAQTPRAGAKVNLRIFHYRDTNAAARSICRMLNSRVYLLCRFVQPEMQPRAVPCPSPTVEKQNCTPRDNSKRHFL